jgi:hypothetical protein
MMAGRGAAQSKTVATGFKISVAAIQNVLLPARLAHQSPSRHSCGGEICQHLEGTMGARSLYSNRHIRLVAAIMGVAFVQACAATPLPPVAPEVQFLDEPAPGSVSVREVGETLVEQFKKSTVEVLIPNQPMKYETALAAGYFTYDGDLKATIRKDGKKVYCATYLQVLGPGQRNALGQGCVDKPILEKYWNMPEGTYRIERVTTVDATNFQRQLIYTGKSGTNLYISYREFSGDLARPAFTQDLTFDLAEGKVIGMKGARIEVIEATNVSIKFKMISTFADG